MRDRTLLPILSKRLKQVPAVVLLGARQVGKTTLVRDLQEAGFEKPVHYLDLERPSDLAKLADAELYLGKLEGELVILDEIQRVPELFPLLRSLIDERRRKGERTAQFLLLGSAAPDLIEQSSETLAGRISFLELNPFHLLELPSEPGVVARHWVRGGFPDAYQSQDTGEAMQWCEDFLRSYVERYLPELGVEASPVELRRLCTMLAHQQGGLLNASQLGNSLGLAAKTVTHYLNLLEGLFIIRSLPAWHRNAGKRLVKSRKIYLRDSGLVHQLLGIKSYDDLLGHPVCGVSWEGYCFQQIMSLLPVEAEVSHYRTHAGAEIDLMIKLPDGRLLGVEIKRTLSPKLTRVMRETLDSLKVDQAYIVIPEGEAFPLSEKVEAIGMREFLEKIEVGDF